MRRQGPEFTPSELRAFTIGVFLLAFGLRVLLAMTSERMVWGDEPFFLWLTGNWLNGQGYTVYQGISDVHFPPGFPLLLAFSRILFDDLSSGSLFWYVVAGTAALVPLFLLAREIYDDFTALLAGLLYAVSPALLTGLAFGGHPADGPYLFFLLSGWYFLYWAFHRDRASDALLAGVSLGVAYLIRNEAVLYFLLFLIGWLIHRLLRTDPPWKRVLSRWGLFAGSFVLFSAPYVFYLNGVLTARGAEMTWTLSGGAEQAHAMAKSLLDGDPVRYDLETWGLDWRKKEVRFFSMENSEVPLLTLFFENPVEFFEDIWQNIRLSFDALTDSRCFGLGLLLLCMLGLFGTPWERKRVWRELFLCWCLLPLIGSWIFYVTERSLYSAIPILLLWSAKGLTHLDRWSSRTVENMKLHAFQRNSETWVKISGLAALLGYFLVLNIRVFFQPYSPDLYDWKIVAGWLENNTAPNAVIMARQPEVAYQARRRWVAFPHAPYPDCLDYALGHRVDYWVFETDVDQTGKSHMIPVIEGRRGEEELEEVYRIELPPKKIYAIYRLRAQTLEKK